MKQVINRLVKKIIGSSPTGASLSNKELNKLRNSSPTGGSIKKRTKPLKK
jgi:hypothetical protein